VRIRDNVARIGGASTNEFEVWDDINGESLSMTLGRDMSDVVSFKITQSLEMTACTQYVLLK